MNLLPSVPGQKKFSKKRSESTAALKNQVLLSRADRYITGMYERYRPMEIFNNYGEEFHVSESFGPGVYYKQHQINSKNNRYSAKTGQGTDHRREGENDQSNLDPLRKRIPL
ncbi:MAG: hypothetical protein JWM28_4264 [Chitinophagaceae bacterium]|nr:hypothetical protein [Chitinophagaceae bacterium]